MHRRNFLKFCAGFVAACIAMPTRAFAEVWNKSAFKTTAMAEAMQQLGVKNVVASAEIQIIAPDRAENGAIVQVEVLSAIVNTESISILVEKNPTPLIATFKFSNGAEPFVITRIKMAETSEITVLVKADQQFYREVKNVVVLENGCG